HLRAFEKTAQGPMQYGPLQRVSQPADRPLSLVKTFPEEKFSALRERPRSRLIGYWRKVGKLCAACDLSSIHSQLTLSTYSDALDLIRVLRLGCGYLVTIDSTPRKLSA